MIELIFRQAKELPSWVASTLGHADTTMVYRHYTRHIKNLTRQDASAIEKQYVEMKKEGSDEIKAQF